MAVKKKAKKASSAKKAKVPTAVQLAGFLELKLTKELTPKQVSGLRKALPGYASLLDNAADTLGDGSLTLKDVSAESLRATQTTRADLLAREQVLYRVWRSAYHQRLQADDEAMGALQKIARRVDALSEDEPDLLDEWKFLTDFFKTFHRKAGAAVAEDQAPPEK